MTEKCAQRATLRLIWSHWWQWCRPGPCLRRTSRRKRTLSPAAIDRRSCHQRRPTHDFASVCNDVVCGNFRHAVFNARVF
jgi:hypothetical protein